MDQQHKHIESLTTYLQPHFDPVHLCELEELCACEGFQQAALLLTYGFLLVQLV